MKRNKLKQNFLSLFAAYLLGFSPTVFAQESSKDQVRNLKVDYASQPIGIDVEKPQLSWEIETKQSGTSQIAYQVLVSDDEQKLKANDGNVWNSNRVESAQSVAVRYNGKPLESQKKYFWKVKVWEKGTGKALESSITHFTTGLMNPNEWTSDWVGFPFGWIGKVLFFRHEFHIPENVVSAQVHFAGIGYHELSINGKKVGKNVLDPATSDYAKRVYYTSFDVKDFLKKENVMLIEVASGWYGVPKLRLQMDILFADGSTRKITSNDIRHVTTGPTVQSGILDGELYDARKEKVNFLLPTDSLFKTIPNENWGVAPIVEKPGGKMVSQQIEPIQVLEEITPIRLSEPKNGVYVLDVGQNLAGWAQLHVKGKVGQEIVLKFAESIYDDGTVNQENLRTAKATDTYILKGDPNGETWEPKFTYHGFRYVQVEGYEYKPAVEDFKIKRVRSAVAEAGKFKSSNELLNRIWLMVKNTEQSNLHSIPTDCPQRDERMGWMNDMTVRIEQAIFNYDMSRFYVKYLDDVADTQDEHGRITCTAPYRYGGRPADPVSASYLLLGLHSYEYYGNKALIENHYKGFKAWVDFLNSWTKDGILEYSYYGDWSPPAEFGVAEAGYGAISANTPGNLVSTGFLYHSADLLQQIAQVLGKSEDVKYYKELMNRTYEAFNAKFWNQQTGGYGSNNQACNSLALSFGLARDERKTKTLANLLKDVEEKGFHLTTGNICTKYLLEELTKNGHVDAAYQIATQKTYPSWGYMLENGATTLWERWEHKTGGSMNSHNHPMMGSVGSWLYKYLLGITADLEKPGFEEFKIKPYLPKGLMECEGSYQSVRGLVKTSWKQANGKVQLHIEVPGNSMAKVYVPTTNSKTVKLDGQAIKNNKSIKFIAEEAGFAIFEVPSGAYHFSSDWKS